MKLLPPTDGERQRLCRLLFICAFGFFVLGFLITFYPGAEREYFIFVACLFLLPMLIPRGGFRALAAGFVFISLLLALRGHWRGVHYRTWLAQHPVNSLAFVNETEHDLERVELHLNGVRIVGPEGLAKGEHATLRFLTEPVLDEALVTWDENSIHHEVTAKLEGIVPSGFANGTIYFIMKSDGSVGVETANFRKSIPRKTDHFQ